MSEQAKRASQMVEAAGIEPATGTKPNLVMACDFRYKWFDSNAFEQVWLSPGVSWSPRESTLVLEE